jgi:hypothetical protein
VIAQLVNSLPASIAHAVASANILVLEAVRGVSEQTSLLASFQQLSAANDVAVEPPVDPGPFVPNPFTAPSGWRTNENLVKPQEYKLPVTYIAIRADPKTPPGFLTYYEELLGDAKGKGPAK